MICRRNSAGRAATVQTADEIRTLAEVERDYIAAALRALGGNRAKAAEKLGIGAATPYRKLKQERQCALDVVRANATVIDVEERHRRSEAMTENRHEGTRRRLEDLDRVPRCQADASRAPAPLVVHPA